MISAVFPCKKVKVDAHIMILASRPTLGFPNPHREPAPGFPLFERPGAKIFLMEPQLCRSACLLPYELPNEMGWPCPAVSLSVLKPDAGLLNVGCWLQGFPLLEALCAKIRQDPRLNQMLGPPFHQHGFWINDLNFNLAKSTVGRLVTWGSVSSSR